MNINLLYSNSFPVIDFIRSYTSKIGRDMKGINTIMGLLSKVLTEANCLLVLSPEQVTTIGKYFNFNNVPFLTSSLNFTVPQPDVRHDLVLAFFRKFLLSEDVLSNFSVITSDLRTQRLKNHSENVMYTIETETSIWTFEDTIEEEDISSITYLDTNLATMVSPPIYLVVRLSSGVEFAIIF